jgi:hypothetical protein
MEFDEVQEMSAIAVRRDFKRCGFGIESDLIFESLIEKLSSLMNEKNTDEVKNQITGIVMLLFAVADELKFDLEDALMNRIEGLNQNG